MLCWVRSLNSWFECVCRFLPLPHLYPARISDANRRTPILAVHGARDKVIPLEFARNRYAVLQNAQGVRSNHSRKFILLCVVPLTIREEQSLEHYTSAESLFHAHSWIKSRLST